MIHKTLFKKRVFLGIRSIDYARGLTIKIAWHKHSNTLILETFLWSFVVNLNVHFKLHEGEKNESIRGIQGTIP